MKKYYADHTNQVTIICPECGLERNMDVTKFKETHKRLKARCRCGEVFRFTLEYRKHYRKKVRLAGEYLVQGKDERGEVIIEDISASGIRFASLRPHFISRNDIVELKFTLDNPMKTQIQGLVKIMWIIDHNVGAEFVNPKSLEKDLGFYLKV
jgi:hypothetical protein